VSAALLIVVRRKDFLIEFLLGSRTIFGNHNCVQHNRVCIIKRLQAHSVFQYQELKQQYIISNLPRMNHN